MDGYADVWERFKKERRLEFGGHTDPEWRRGHALSASFVAPVEASGLWDRLEPLREALKPFPFVSLHPEHFMHVTLTLLGFLLPEPGSDGEISRERLEELEAQARAALKDFPAFAVELANLNAFPGAAFVEVRDGGMLEELRGALRDVCGFEEAEGPLHLTLAYLQAPDGAPVPEEFVAAVERYRDWSVGTFHVQRVELTLLDLYSSTYPKLDIFAKIQLGN